MLFSFYFLSRPVILKWSTDSCAPTPTPKDIWQCLKIYSLLRNGSGVGDGDKRDTLLVFGR